MRVLPLSSANLGKLGPYCQGKCSQIRIAALRMLGAKESQNVVAPQEVFLAPRATSGRDTGWTPRQLSTKLAYGQLFVTSLLAVQQSSLVHFETVITVPDVGRWNCGEGTAVQASFTDFPPAFTSEGGNLRL